MSQEINKHQLCTTYEWVINYSWAFIKKKKKKLALRILYRKSNIDYFPENMNDFFLFKKKIRRK